MKNFGSGIVVTYNFSYLKPKRKTNQTARYIPPPPPPPKENKNVPL